MKVIYIAHPISGDIAGNLKKIVQIAREINLNELETVPVANYFLDCHALDDTNLLERERGIKNDTELFKRGYIDEVRLYGSRISQGMVAEIQLAQSLSIPVVPMTYETKQIFQMLNDV